jgi:Cu/Ag efflux pump CusA
VKSLEDIGEIVVKNINGIPVYIKMWPDVLVA